MSETINVGDIEEGHAPTPPSSDENANDNNGVNVSSDAAEVEVASDDPSQLLPSAPTATGGGIEEIIDDGDLPPPLRVDETTMPKEGSGNVMTQTAFASGANASGSGGIEEIAAHGPPVPFARTLGSIVDTEASSKPPSSRASVIEQIDDDYVGPQPLHNDTNEDEVNGKVRANAAAAAATPRLLEEIDDESPQLVASLPNNNDQDEGGGSALDKKKAAYAPPASSVEHEAQAVQNPTSTTSNEEEIEVGQEGEEMIHTAPPVLQGVDLAEDQRDIDNSGEDNSISPNSQDDIENPSDTFDASAANAAAAAHEEGVHVIPEAQLVEEADLVMAEPMAPWYKQRRTRMLLSLVCLLTIAAAIAIGISANREEAPAELVLVTLTESPSSSLSPSYSAVPSMAPTSCAFTIMSNVQKLEMIHDDPYLPSIKVDGTNAIAVMHGSNPGSDFHVVFYALSNNGQWERNSIFIDEKSDQFYPGASYSSAISGDVAMVGLYQKNTPGVGAVASEDGEDRTGFQAGIVRVYRRNQGTGLWEMDEDPLLPSDGGSYFSWFGYSIDIDGDLACIISAERGKANIFKQDSEYAGTSEKRRWTEIDEFKFDFGPYSKCLVVGTTIGFKVENRQNDTNRFEELHLFAYNDTSSKFEPLQDPIPVGVPVSQFQVALTQDYLIFSEFSFSISENKYVSDGLHIYRRQNEQGPYTPFQFLNASDYSYTFGMNLGMDKDTLAVFSNSTIIFSERDGYWEESLVLDQPYFDYQLSGRHLLVTGFDLDVSDIYLDTQNGSSISEAIRLIDVYAFNLEDCMQQMPTQFPSTSGAPSGSVNLAPCYQVNITISFDEEASQTKFDVKKLNVNEYGDDITVYTYGGNYFADSSQTKSWSLCLEEAEYQFSINDTFGDGICCDNGYGNYSVTSGGRVIAQGGEFGESESTTFPIPYVLIPSAMPSSSLAPSPPLPSSSPTLPCYPVEFSIKTDNHPNETALNLLGIVTTDDRQENLCSLYDSRARIDFRVNGIYICHISGYTATDTSVTGEFCACGYGLTQCTECQDKICVIERGQNLLHEKVANCEFGGGLAAVIYNDGKDPAGYVHPLGTGIPVVFINQSHGQILAGKGLVGWSASISATAILSSFEKKMHTYIEPLCLPEGEFVFSIVDYGGDGICCDHGEGSYTVKSDGRIIAQGGEFGASQSTRFSLPYFHVPSAAPSLSHAPSSSQSPSLMPSLSLPPTEVCYWTEVNIRTDAYPSHTSWRLSQQTTVDGLDEVNIIYDNRPMIDLKVIGLDGRKYEAFHFENSLIDVDVTGALCDCALGISKCDCQGQVCLIQRGNILFDDKIKSCEDGGGLATIIYNNKVGIQPSYATGAGITAIFISQADGQYLFEEGIGKTATLTVSDQPLPLKANVANSRRMCLEEGQYVFDIWDDYHDGVCCKYGDGWYNITSEGNLIAQEVGDYGMQGTTNFSIPFTPAALLTSSVSGFAFLDSDRDGIRDTGNALDSAIENISISLLSCNDEIIMTTKTDGTGYYSFDELEEGEYYMQVDPSQDQLQWYKFSDVWMGKVDENEVPLHPNVESAVDPNTGRTACFSLDVEEEKSFSFGMVLNLMQRSHLSEPDLPET